MSKSLEAPFQLRNGSRHAFTPEELGTMNVKGHEIVQTAIEIFDDDMAAMDLNPEQRAEALAIFSAKMSAGVEDFVETVRRASTKRSDF